MGIVIAIGSTVGLVFTVRAFRSYPNEPEPLTMAEALSRAETEGVNKWISVSAPALRCDLAFRDEHSVYVPLAQQPLVLAQYQGHLDCSAIDRAHIVGTIRRPPARWVERFVGPGSGPVYELTTWGGRENAKWGLYLALIGLVLGTVLGVAGPTLARKSAQNARMAA
jgi:hypothetical protein